MGKPRSKVNWKVTCPIHGKEDGTGKTRWVIVAPPKGKNDRKTRGCPMCKAEKNKVLLA